jgi:hypothetical protein
LKLLSFGDGTDWALRPVMRGLIKYESLIDGTLDIYDLGVLNDAIDMEEENTRKIRDLHNGI